MEGIGIIICMKKRLKEYQKIIGELKNQNKNFLSFFLYIV